MKAITTFIIISALLVGMMAKGQNQSPKLVHYWQIGFGLGELPIGGSFKPSITLGYYFNEKIYVGIIYQFKDEINRNKSSFNAKSSELDGLLSSSEMVAQRSMFQVRYTPLKNGPYFSGGFVYNGKDKETMYFDSRYREFSGEGFEGTVGIQQTRPAGWGFALGLGYQYNFKNGFSTGFEWTPAWGQYPTPSYQFSGSSGLSEKVTRELKDKMDEGFKNSVTNMYKVFHIGIAYRFQ